MILGIGVDVVDIAAFREQLADPASSFVSGSFTAGEQRDVQQRPAQDKTQHYAVRYAAKEAWLKAWSGARRGRTPALPRVDLRDIEVVMDPHHRPALRFHGHVADALSDLGPFRAHLSMSHDGPTATAFVILESKS